ncbi:hypothetical protein D6D00_08999 [Aureobasidium pullulans]|uniref:Uncharacterized protein n=1 Tax=Aureobasidium pullulans TaxID=5580 RepID=A0A4S9KJC9_AURPU|nr:hypothetical protein D6D28_03671 [Aureobasidium pullulans]THY16171.1 hypothetical protein D6D00_08999 [Aureobasidium pullulans]
MFSNGVTKNAPATAYTPTPHALDALMKALDDDAVPIKREPESDPIYRERSFSLAQSISSLVHAPTIEPELIEGVIYTTKQEPAPLHFVEDASLVNFDAHHQGCSAVSTDEDVKYDCRSRVSSISGIDSGSEMSPKVQLKHEIYLPNDPKSDYNTIIRGSDPKNEPYKAPSIEQPRFTHAGNSSRSYWEQFFCEKAELIEQKAEESRLREQQIAEHKAEELRLKDKQIAEQEAEFKQAIQQLKNKKMKEEEEERRLKRVKDGIDTRHRLAPRRQVTESESFLIGRLVIEVRTAEAAAEFAVWANSKMNFHEKQEYNRMLWIIKGREAKDLMLEVPGGSELEHLWS